MMKLTAAVLVSILFATETNSFAPSNSLQQHQTSTISKHASLMATSPDGPEDSTTNIDRRSLFSQTAYFVATATVGSLLTPTSAQAATATAAPKAQTVVVAGATGQTGRRILERLAGQPGLTVIGGVRNIDKASKTLSESSTVVRGAMVQKAGSIDTAGVDLKRIDA